MRPAAIIAALSLAAPLFADVQIGPREGRMRLQASRAPLSEILDRLAHETGMKVVYEGAPPQELITTTVDGANALEVLLALLEGVGRNYAMRLDVSGTQAVTLVIVAANDEASSAAATPVTPDARPADENEAFDPGPAFRDRIVTDPATGDGAASFVDFDEAAAQPALQGDAADLAGATGTVATPDPAPSPSPSPSPAPTPGPPLPTTPPGRP